MSNNLLLECGVFNKRAPILKAGIVGSCRLAISMHEFRIWIKFYLSGKFYNKIIDDLS